MEEYLDVDSLNDQVQALKEDNKSLKNELQNLRQANVVKYLSLMSISILFRLKNFEN